MSDISRRKFIQIGGVGVIGAGFLGSGDNLFKSAEAKAAESARPSNGEEALKALMDGNKRFIKRRKKGV